LARRFTKLDRDRVYASHEKYYKEKIRRTPRPLTKEQFREMVMRDRGMNLEDHDYVDSYPSGGAIERKHAE
jgi:hypothetical protein